MEYGRMHAQNSAKRWKTRVLSFDGTFMSVSILGSSAGMFIVQASQVEV